MNVNKWILSACFCVLFVLSQVIVTQWAWINHLRRQVDIFNQANRIEENMVQDIMMQLTNAKYENSTVGSQQFVAGVLAAIQDPDRYNEIWHAGYERGTDVQRYDSKFKKESAYTGQTE